MSSEAVVVEESWRSKILWLIVGAVVSAGVGAGASLLALIYTNVGDWFYGRVSQPIEFQNVPTPRSIVGFEHARFCALSMVASGTNGEGQVGWCKVWKGPNGWMYQTSARVNQQSCEALCIH